MSRLIDADVLLEQMQPVSTFEINSYAEAAAMTIANAYIKLVENQPTVEAPDINVGNIDTTTHDSIPAETGKNDGDETSGDCISRQRSVDTLRKMQTYKLFAGDDMLLINQAEAQTELMMLPPAEPERKTGRWLPDNTDYYRTRFICSVCGESEEVPTMGFGYAPMWGYCPNCGADNRGKTE
jgi:hypothetical protein